MRRIALLHYTGPSAIGGVEELIRAQVEALTELGCRVRLIVGSGGRLPRTETVHVTLVDPAHGSIRRGIETLGGDFPLDDHPLVDCLAAELQKALRGCEQCWAHNAFTVYLNPFLTAALWRLARHTPEVRWVAWCEDISSISAFWTSTFAVPLAPADGAATVRYVTISETRRRELSAHFGLSASEIEVVRPPLDVYEWMDVGPEARALAARLDLESAWPVILAPAKLLPHKNLERAVRLAAALKHHTPRPLVLLTATRSPHQPETSRQVHRDLMRLRHELRVEDYAFMLTDLLSAPPARHTVRDLMLLSDFIFFPSVEEGFGLPVREAAIFGTPVMCSDIPALREAAGETAHFFSLEETDENLALRALAIAGLPANQARHEALQSVSKFRDQIASLLR